MYIVSYVHTYFIVRKLATFVYYYNYSYLSSICVVKPQLPSTSTQGQPQSIQSQLPPSKPEPPPVKPKPPPVKLKLPPVKPKPPPVKPKLPPVKPKPPQVKPKQPSVQPPAEPQVENDNSSKSTNDGMLIMLTNTYLYVLHMY